MTLRNRIAETFARLKAEARTGLIAYLTVGYPDLAATPQLVRAAVAGGASIIELGIPFSDPLADGATHQRASAEALSHGTTLADCLAVARAVRAEGVETPLILMGYYNTMLSYGPSLRQGEGKLELRTSLERLATDVAEAGADGVIPVDLPPEEARPLLDAAKASGLDVIFFLAPTSTTARIKVVARAASGFVYCVSLAGVTGARAELPEHLPAFIKRVRAHATLPLAVGFGISRREHVEAIGRLAEAAVVGSALTDVIAQAGPDGATHAVRDFVAQLADASLRPRT